MPATFGRDLDTALGRTQHGVLDMFSRCSVDYRPGGDWNTQVVRHDGFIPVRRVGVNVGQFCAVEACV